jgi:hypothetical protein
MIIEHGTEEQLKECLLSLEAFLPYPGQVWYFSTVFPNFARVDVIRMKAEKVTFRIAGESALYRQDYGRWARWVLNGYMRRRLS